MNTQPQKIEISPELEVNLRPFRAAFDGHHELQSELIVGRHNIAYYPQKGYEDNSQVTSIELLAALGKINLTFPPSALDGLTIVNPLAPDFSAANPALITGPHLHGTLDTIAGQFTHRDVLMKRGKKRPASSTAVAIEGIELQIIPFPFAVQETVYLRSLPVEYYEDAIAKLMYISARIFAQQSGFHIAAACLCQCPETELILFAVTPFTAIARTFIGKDGKLVKVYQKSTAAWLRAAVDWAALWPVRYSEFGRMRYATNAVINLKRTLFNTAQDGWLAKATLQFDQFFASQTCCEARDALWHPWYIARSRKNGPLWEEGSLPVLNADVFTDFCCAIPSARVDDFDRKSSISQCWKGLEAELKELRP